MITFEHNGTTYNLEFTRKTAVMAERRGLDVNELSNKPHIHVPLLVWGAFQANHHGINDKKARDIYSSLSDKSGFIAALADEYGKTYEDLFGSEDDEDKGNLVKWSVQ